MFKNPIFKIDQKLSKVVEPQNERASSPGHQKEN
jgi:hypothetical protein